MADAFEIVNPDTFDLLRNRLGSGAYRRVGRAGAQMCNHCLHGVHSVCGGNCSCVCYTILPRKRAMLLGKLFVERPSLQ
jgi:hypothetical protein